MENPDQEGGTSNLKKCTSKHWQGLVIFMVAISFFIAMLINDSKQCRCLYLIIAMFVCWITEVFPLAITAMFPIFSFPLMNIMASDKTCSLYFKETTVGFIICIIIACSIEFTNLHKRLAVHICETFGSNPKRLHFLLVAMTYCLSMLIPNATCITLMYPLTYALLELLSSQGICKIYEDDSQDIPKKEKRPSKIAKCFYLSIAYASSIGGSATLIGSPSNIVFIDIYEDQFPHTPDDISFERFIIFALPPMLLYTGIMFLTMEHTYMGLFRPNSSEAKELQFSEEGYEAAKRIVKNKSEEIGKITMAECTVATLVFSMVILMFTREPDFVKGWGYLSDEIEIDNATITAIIIFLVFSLPGNLNFLKCWNATSNGETSGLLNWKFVNATVPWDLIFVIGCGGAIAEGCRISGFARSLGNLLTNLKYLPPPLSLFILIILVELFTNFTVNTAAMEVLTPGIIQLAIESKIHPLFFLMPAGLAGSMGFLMPAGTPPNALVAAYANIRTREMIWAGIRPTIFAALIIYIFTLTWGFVAYRDLWKFPEWVSFNVTKPDYGDES